MEAKIKLDQHVKENMPIKDCPISTWIKGWHSLETPCTGSDNGCQSTRR